MNEQSLKKSLSKLELGGLRYFDSIGSTNDEALAWAASNEEDLSIVIADEQTRGRGRLHRTWHTPKGSALAVSLILRPDKSTSPHLSRIVGSEVDVVREQHDVRGEVAIAAFLRVAHERRKALRHHADVSAKLLAAQAE